MAPKMQNFVVFLSLALAVCSAYYTPKRKGEYYDKKRPMPDSAGNKCPEDRPFPCRDTTNCIPLEFVCDRNWDCEDGLDEDTEVCTAAVRLPVDQMAMFLKKQKWMSVFFDDKTNQDIAHGLAVSPTIDDFQEKLGLDDKQIGNFEKALEAVTSGDRKTLVKFGMPSSAWSGVETLFNSLTKTGFL